MPINTALHIKKQSIHIDKMKKQVFVNFVVGGRHYSMNLSHIRKYPGSYFNTVIKKEWHENPLEPVIIDRDGEVFKYIVDFHFYREFSVILDWLSTPTVKTIQAEADFYNLSELVKECDRAVVKQIDVRDHRTRAVDCEYWSKNKDNLVNVLGSVRAPFCLTGEEYYTRASPLFQSSTLKKLNVSELIAAAVPSHFGMGQESVMDTDVRRSFEISTERLNQDTLNKLTDDFFSLATFAPRMKLEVRPYKLVIYPEGGHFTEHRDSVRGDGHIGTLVYILNSEFTGGEFVVRQNKEEVSISHPFQWIAMYGDCPHRVEPVTSGTRVSLLFDLYNVGTVDKETLFEADHLSGGNVDESRARAVDATARQSICTALDKELRKYSDVVICLEHRYPVLQAVPSGMKGCDEVLYSMLLDTGAYELSITPIKVYKSSYHGCCYDQDYISGDIVRLNLCERNKPRGKIKLIIPAAVDSAEVLYSTEFIEHVGNEPQAEQYTYLCTGLRVTNKKVVEEGVGEALVDEAEEEDEEDEEDEEEGSDDEEEEVVVEDEVEEEEKKEVVVEDYEDEDEVVEDDDDEDDEEVLVVVKKRAIYPLVDKPAKKASRKA